MAHYSQWAKTRKTPRVAWVCGPEPVLRYDVADTYRAAYPLVPCASLRADEEVWDYLLTVPHAPRLTYVYGAEGLRRRDLVRHLLEDEFDGAFTVFVAAENDFPKAVYIDALRDSKHGLLVRCSTPRDPEAQAQLVASWWPGAGRNLGAEVLARCGGDLGAARHAVRKAACAGLAPGADAVRLVCVPGAHGDYADCLVAYDAKKAMAAAALIDPEEAGAALGLLSSRLSVLALLGDAARKVENVREFARRQKIDPYLARMLSDHARPYTPDKVAACRRLLALAESSWRRGARDGVLEAVAALWLCPGNRDMASDNVEHPAHYTSLGAACRKCGHPIEAIDITELFNFTLGNVIKYVWRAGLKGSLTEDLRKAQWYLQREVERLTRGGRHD